MRCHSHAHGLNQPWSRVRSSFTFHPIHLAVQPFASAISLLVGRGSQLHDPRVVAVPLLRRSTTARAFARKRARHSSFATTTMEATTSTHVEEDEEDEDAVERIRDLR